MLNGALAGCHHDNYEQSMIRLRYERDSASNGASSLPTTGSAVGDDAALARSAVRTLGDGSGASAFAVAECIAPLLGYVRRQSLGGCDPVLDEPSEIPRTARSP